VVWTILRVLRVRDQVPVPRTGPGGRPVTRTGLRLTRTAAYRLLQRLAHKADIAAAGEISPHSTRHAFATLALDAGVPLRDVQDAKGHADPRTTRRYNRSRHSLDRHATYAVAAYLPTGEAT